MNELYVAIGAFTFGFVLAWAIQSWNRERDRLKDLTDIQKKIFQVKGCHPNECLYPNCNCNEPV